MLEIGDKIRIDYMSGEPQYTGKEGIVKYIVKDLWGDIAVRGTWGGLSLYLNKDHYTIIEKKSVQSST